jgi:hypothetical protein
MNFSHGGPPINPSFGNVFNGNGSIPSRGGPVTSTPSIMGANLSKWPTHNPLSRSHKLFANYTFTNDVTTPSEVAFGIGDLVFATRHLDNYAKRTSRVEHIMSLSMINQYLLSEAGRTKYGAETKASKVAKDFKFIGSVEPARLSASGHIDSVNVSVTVFGSNTQIPNVWFANYKDPTGNEPTLGIMSGLWIVLNRVTYDVGEDEADISAWRMTPVYTDRNVRRLNGECGLKRTAIGDNPVMYSVDVSTRYAYRIGLLTEKRSDPRNHAIVSVAQECVYPRSASTLSYIKQMDTLPRINVGIGRW